MRQCTKSYQFGQMVAEIWRFNCFFSKWPTSTILDLMGADWDHPRRPLDGLYRCANFGWNRCSSFDNMKLSIFCPFGLKTPIQAPKIGVFGEFHPQNGEQCQRNPPKRHILARVRVVWAIKRKNPSTGLTCRRVHEKGINKKIVIFHPFAQKPPMEGFAPNLAQP